MKMFKRLAKLLIATMICCSMFSVTAFASVDKPTHVWDLSSDGRYDFYGDASNNDLYTNYNFTGVSKMKVYIKNTGSGTLTVWFFKKGDLFAANTIKVNEGSETTVNMGSLSSTTQYVFKFDAPCHFIGWVQEG